MLPAIALQRAATAARGGGRRQGALVVGLAPEARQGGVVGVVQRGPTIARSPTRRCLSVATAATPPSLAALPPDLRADDGRALELAERAAAGWSLTHTDFLPPPAAAAALGALRQLADVAGVAWGGFAGAERVRLTVGRRDLVEAVTPEALASDPDAGGVAALAVRGRFTFDPATHRDFLGAALGSAGLNRRVVGDVVVQGEKGATLFVAPTAVEALEVSLTQVGVGLGLGLGGRGRRVRPFLRDGRIRLRRGVWMGWRRAAGGLLLPTQPFRCPPSCHYRCVACGWRRGPPPWPTWIWA